MDTSDSIVVQNAHIKCRTGERRVSQSVNHFYPRIVPRKIARDLLPRGEPITCQTHLMVPAAASEVESNGIGTFESVPSSAIQLELLHVTFEVP